MTHTGKIDQSSPNEGQTRRRIPSRMQQLNSVYSLPAPLRTFPLPTFIPHNPVSLLQILYTWLSQTIKPPTSHGETQYQAWYSPATRSVHVTDARAIRALWEQGFYGKGSLSRSEPSWLDREKRRTGVSADKTSEEVTRQRRAERQQVKWERARKEREAIEEKLLEEQSIDLHLLKSDYTSQANLRDDICVAPVGPLELLKLPNSAADLSSGTTSADKHTFHQEKIVGNGYINASLSSGITRLPVSSEEDSVISLTLENSGQLRIQADDSITGSIDVSDKPNGSSVTNGLGSSSRSPKNQKVVRFSPTVEQTTFIQSEPPSPDLAATSVAQADEETLVIEDQEHLQLTMEEAFFLSYGLGVLEVLDPKTKHVIPIKDLFALGRQSSYFLSLGSPLPSSPDDSFMLSYVVYHHFRSLGWVVRGGTKFSVDYLLYNRGPVFSHAEFAVLIMPSYNDLYWTANEHVREYVSRKEKRRWSWLHCINRVNNQVKKTLVLVYVDIPPPLASPTERELGIDEVLGRYKVREIILKRWLSNRSRD